MSLFGHGAVDGFRIDHPDGLADPRGYLAMLADATGDGWVVVEKILEGDEPLPDDWRCMGTTGYDALLRVQQVLTSPAGEDVLDRLWDEHASGTSVSGTLESVIVDAKRLVVDDVQAAEVDRLMRLLRRVLPTEDPRPLRRALEAMLVAMDRYRAYFTPGEEADVAQYAVVDEVEARARSLVAPGDADAVAVVAQLVRGGRLPRLRWARCQRRRSSVPASSRPVAPSWPRASRTPPSTAGSGWSARTRSVGTRKPSRSPPPPSTRMPRGGSSVGPSR